MINPSTFLSGIKLPAAQPRGLSTATMWMLVMLNVPRVSHGTSVTPFERRQAPVCYVRETHLGAHIAPRHGCPKINGNNLSKFDYASLELRVLTVMSEPWFADADLRRALGINRYGTRLAKLAHDETQIVRKCGSNTLTGRGLRKRSLQAHHAFGQTRGSQVPRLGDAGRSAVHPKDRRLPPE